MKVRRGGWEQVRRRFEVKVKFDSATVTTLRTGTSVAAMDADLASGPVATRHAVATATHLARRTGTTLVTVRRAGEVPRGFRTETQ